MKRSRRSGRPWGGPRGRAGAVLVAGSLVLGGLNGCAGEGGGPLLGAGATFVMPLVMLWSSEYHEATDKRVDYNSIGSGGGIRSHIDGTVDFAASEAPLHPDQAARAPGTLTLPFTIGTVSLSYNLPGVDDLRFSGDVLADIYLGEIERWDHERIRGMNPDVPLPDRAIEVVHRSDGAGTTFIFTDYLSQVSPEWEERVGHGTAVAWPVGIGGNGNEGVAGAIRNNRYSIGYVELGFAIQTGMTTVALENREGVFVEPTLEGGTAAAAQVVDDLPAGHEDWYGVGFTNAPGEESYPVSGFSFFLVHEEMSRARRDMTRERAEDVVQWLEWTIQEGQRHNERVSQAPVPEAVRELNLETLDRITYQGEPLRDR